MIRPAIARLAICIALTCWPVPLLAQEPPETLPPASQPATLQEQIASARAAVAAELAVVKPALEAIHAKGETPSDHLVKEVDLLSRLDLTYGQILSAAEHEAELQASRAQLETELATLRSQGPPEPRPYAFPLLETLRDELAVHETRTESLTEAAKAAQASLTMAREVLTEKERARRQAKEASESNKDEASKARLDLALCQAQLESRLASEEVRLREIELQNQKIEEQVGELRKTFLQEKTELVAREVQFTQEALDEILVDIDKLEDRLTQSLEWAKADLKARDQQWLEARSELDASATKDQALTEKVEARKLARQLRQREVTLLGQQLQALVDSRQAWNRRHQTFNQMVEPPVLKEWLAETQQHLKQLERDLRVYSTRLSELRQEALTLDSKIAASADAPQEVTRWLDEQKRQLNNLIRIFEGTVNRLEASRRLHEKLLHQIDEQVSTVSLWERTKATWQVVTDIWNYEITSVQDNPITVKKIVIGLVLLLIGIFVSRTITSLIAKRFLTRFGLTEGATAAIQSLLFYLLVLMVTMLSLRVVNVPLTAFTILGGALAIGIGFGSQNVMNNFISGLILLGERPIRVGDLIQIEDLIGVVEHIGPRSTRVRSPQNMDIIVPNSSFLEKNVINWTLSDDRSRTHVTVGVVYGSPTREVTQLIRKAIDEHGKVLTKPAPIILFAEFGDNALVFEAHFWVRMRRIMDRRIIESDIRHRVDTLFREAGIVVAFPQRDVHLDTTAPLQIQMLSNDKADESTE